MSLLLSADLHLTSNPRDEYRWGIFPWLAKQAVKHNVHAVLILGDLTDAKDRHSSFLVNRFVAALRDYVTVPWYLLAGNHDFVDNLHPFFGFVSDLKVPVTFITKPKTLRFGAERVLLLPCTRNYKEDWAEFDFNKYDLILTHQTFDGAKAENGTCLQGIPPSVFKSIKGHVWSGDIHVPQDVSRTVSYVGAPYRVRFGDSFRARVVLLDPDGNKDLHFRTTSRRVEYVDSVSDLRDIEIPAGDQVKVRVRLKRKHHDKWSEMRKEITALAQEQGWELCGLELLPQTQAKGLRGSQAPGDGSGLVSSEERVRAYAKAKKLDAKTGVELLKE